MRRTSLFIVLFILLTVPLFSQAVKKKVSAKFCTGAIRIDGILDEQCWQDCHVADSFIQTSPLNGTNSAYRTEVKFLYDNSGLYIGAMMYDPSPDSILMQLGLRDTRNLNADNFMVVLSPFNNGVDAFCFKVYSSDVQVDFKIPDAEADGRGDVSWDAVWESKARKNSQGWVVEMKIPYSAIRFPNTSEQSWGINCQREVRRVRELSTWNFVDSKVTGYVNQEGTLENIRNIKPPLRLALFPYVSGYLEKNPENKDAQLSYNYGADLKYGINQSFTLDMTLIPDFGQVPSDDKVYNFTPFEIRYDEKRQFFTEGTEMFSKGGIFYSRRIGGPPIDYSNVSALLDSNEKITDNPMQTKLLNATKVSGRTNKGLGIGVFEALSGNTWAEAADTVTGAKRKILVQGFTNYNMVVFDQSLKHSSYLDFLNTNYYIPGKGYMANVSGTAFRFVNAGYTYSFAGNAFISQKYNPHANADLGYHYNLAFSKIRGNFLYTLNELLETDRYDPNDMGYNDRNNKFNNSVVLEYNVYQPFWRFLNAVNNISFSYRCLYDGLKYNIFEVHTTDYFTNRKYLTMGVETDIIPLAYHDYYEARVPGCMYIQPSEATFMGMISSDYRKAFALDMEVAYGITSAPHSDGYELDFSPRIRVSNRLFFVYKLSYQNILNRKGYIFDTLNATGNHVILFGKRDEHTVINQLTADFMFSSKISLDIKVRHYWLVAPVKEFYRLNEDGTLAFSDYNGTRNLNYNLFNIDFTFLWNFAPGSQVSLVWKNAIYSSSSTVSNDFFRNFHDTMNSPATNSFSIRFLYYLDAAALFKAQHKI